MGAVENQRRPTEHRRELNRPQLCRFPFRHDCVRLSSPFPTWRFVLLPERGFQGEPLFLRDLIGWRWIDANPDVSSRTMMEPGIPSWMALNPLPKFSALAYVEHRRSAALCHTKNDINGCDIYEACVCERIAGELITADGYVYWSWHFVKSPLTYYDGPHQLMGNWICWEGV